jgi:Ca2+-binding RTX toxin-like protein
VPGANQAEGDIWINRDGAVSVGGLDAGSGLYAALLHEIGHALGLKHPFESPSLADAGQADKDNDQYTLMSYTARFDSLVADADVAAAYNWRPETPMLYDIGALQSIYGSNDLVQGNVYAPPSERPFFMTIWDGGGEDTIDASAFLGDSVIDLRDGAYSSLGAFVFREDGVWLEDVPEGYVGPAPTYGGDNLAIAYGTVIENAVGGGGDDLLAGNAASNNLSGGVGDDTLRGGGASDTLNGGAGDDSFVFDSLSGIDTIVQFEAGDWIVLDNTAFVTLAVEGALAATAFRSGANAKAGADASDRVIFDTAGGGLYYDADGLGGVVSVQFAQITGTVTAGDILVS